MRLTSPFAPKARESVALSKSDSSQKQPGSIIIKPHDQVTDEQDDHDDPQEYDEFVPLVDETPIAFSPGDSTILSIAEVMEKRKKRRRDGSNEVDLSKVTTEQMRKERRKRDVIRGVETKQDSTREGHTNIKGKSPWREIPNIRSDFFTSNAFLNVFKPMMRNKHPNPSSDPAIVEAEETRLLFYRSISTLIDGQRILSMDVWDADGCKELISEGIKASMAFSKENFAGTVTSLVRPSTYAVMNACFAEVCVARAAEEKRPLLFREIVRMPSLSQVFMYDICRSALLIDLGRAKLIDERQTLAKREKAGIKALSMWTEPVSQESVVVVTPE